MDDDVLMEILVRLPPKSLYRFRCVSKTWNNMISDSFFLKSYSARHHAGGGGGGGRLLAFVQRTTKHLSRKYPRPRYEHPMKIRPILLPDNNLNIIKYVPRTLGYFINSSNGLILCGRHPATYYVLNPVTKRWVSLPPPPRSSIERIDTSIGLMCEENTSELVAKYIVVRAAIPRGGAKDNILRIETYSSETGAWDESTLIGTENFRLLRDSEPPLVMNGVFHWYSSMWTIAVYDPNDGGENHVQLIEMPNVGGEYKFSRAITRSEEDMLCFGVIDIEERMKFFILPKGEGGSYKRRTTIPGGEWVSIYDISVDSLWSDAALWSNERRRNTLLEAFIPWKPIVAFLRQEAKVFLYNTETKSINSIQYHGRPVTYDTRKDYLCPYLESFFLSSYSL